MNTNMKTKKKCEDSPDGPLFFVANKVEAGCYNPVRDLLCLPVGKSDAFYEPSTWAQGIHQGPSSMAGPSL